MKTRQIFLHHYRRAQWLALLLSVLVLAGHFVIPHQRIALTTDDHHSHSLYGYNDLYTGRSATWLSQANQHWRCNYQAHHSFGCGWGTRLFTDNLYGTDLSDFEAIELRMHYVGPAKRIRVYIRNFNKAYATIDNPESSKAMTTTFPVAETSGPITIAFNEFAVAEWWLLERRARQQWPQPEFTGVVSIGVDFIDKGDHEVRIEQLTLVKPWIKTESLLLWLLGGWMCVFILEGLTRFGWLYYRVTRERQRLRAMAFKQQQLQVENAHLANLANTDPLTGLLNRAGLQHRLDERYSELQGHGLGLLLLDLDHFKKLNDQHGHDMGDRVLKAFASLLAMNLRGNDIFARIGGEEFVIICDIQPLEQLLAFAEKLRKLATKCEFNGDTATHLTTSIGVTTFTERNEFEHALIVADKALYQAKANGRNCIVYEALHDH